MNWKLLIIGLLVLVILVSGCVEEEETVEEEVDWEVSCNDVCNQYLGKKSCSKMPIESFNFWRSHCMNYSCECYNLSIKVGTSCEADFECFGLDCSAYDTSVKEGYKPFCIENKCKCMCYGCE